MSKVIKLEWAESAEELQQRYRAERGLVQGRRLHALWLVRRGSGIEDAGRASGVDGRTVYRWLARYRAGGLELVIRRPPPRDVTTSRGRLSDAQQRALLERCTTGGFRSYDDVCAWVRTEFGVEYTYQGMYAVLRRHGVRLSAIRSATPSASAPR